MNQQPPMARSRLVRWLLIAAGWISLVLGLIGVFLPLLPTTPFLLLSAACWVRSSERFYHWLLNHKLFGPPIRSWREDRVISRKAKIMATVAMVFTVGLSVAFVIPVLAGKIGTTVFCSGVLTWIWMQRSEPLPQLEPAVIDEVAQTDAERPEDRAAASQRRLG